MKYLFSIVALLFYAVSASAQFYTTGDDPGSLKWSRIRTGHYDVIYPCGLDSLAGEYALNLEKYRLDVSRSAGYAPGEYTRTRMPVILHAYNAQSNGVVVWAPKRMELFTTPQAYSPEPMPWIQNLAIHESRHVAQMQQGMSRGKAFLYGAFSGAVEPICAVITVLALPVFLPVMPFLLAFAAGAMLYVVVEELIPAAHLSEHSDAGTLAVIVGFALMMALDTALG